jgi:hypothetical protein
MRCALLAALACAGAAACAQEAALQSPFTEMMLLRDARSARASSYDRTGGNQDWLTVAPGATATLADIEGAGCIKHIYWAYIIGDPAARRILFRDMILRIYWDEEAEPSVESPIGDFFGVGACRPRPIRSLLLVTNPGMGTDDVTWGMNAYFPMPFEKRARIELTNDSGVPFGIWYHIDYETYPDGAPEGMERLGRFHAQFRRSRAPETGPPTGINTTGESNYVILEATGHGNLAGYVLTVDNVTGGWWGEGDDMVFIDGEAWPPSINGTGTEEIFGGGACPDKEYSGPYTGFHSVENRDGDPHFGKNSMYRFFVQDPIRFRTGIRVTIEHGHANDLRNDYSSVAYWYQSEPHAPFPPLPSREERQPITDYPGFPGVEGAIEGETLVGTATIAGGRAQSLRFPGEWSRARFLWYVPSGPGDHIALKVAVEAEGTYRVLMYLVKASDFGIFQLRVDGREQGSPSDGYNGEAGIGPTHVVRAEAVPFGEISLTAGTHEFRSDVTGKNDRSTSYMVGVDCIVLERVK